MQIATVILSVRRDVRGDEVEAPDAVVLLPCKTAPALWCQEVGEGDKKEAT